MLFCKCFNFLLGLSFSSKIARFAKEFAIHLWSDILPSFYNKVVPDIFIFKFCFILYYPFKAFGFISVIPRITYMYEICTHMFKVIRMWLMGHHLFIHLSKIFERQLWFMHCTRVWETKINREQSLLSRSFQSWKGHRHINK